MEVITKENNEIDSPHRKQEQIYDPDNTKENNEIDSPHQKLEEVYDWTINRTFLIHTVT